MTSLRDKIPVEPLSSSRVARVEENVLSAYRDADLTAVRARRTVAATFAYLAGAVAVCGVAFAVYLNLRAAGREPARSARVSPAQPTVTAVATGAGESTTLTLGDAEVVVGAESSIEITRLASGGITVELRTGRVDCDVEPRAGRAPFAVRAGDVAVTVVGTAFSVERGEIVVVHVTRGRVHVAGPDGATSVAAGEEWSGRATRLAMNEPTAAEPAPASVSPAVASPARAQAPKPELHARSESRVPKPERPERADRDQDSVARPDADSRAAAEASTPVRERRPSSRAAARAALPPLPEDYPLDAHTAAERYRNSIGAGGTKERQEMYHYAYLQLFVLHKSRAAIETVETFQRRFRAGEFTEDMLGLRILATCTDGDPSADCRKAAHAYLARFPQGKYRDLALDIVDPM